MPGRAVSVMVVPARAWLTGQLALASSAAAVKASASIPSTSPCTDRSIPVMPVPGGRVTRASLRSRAGPLTGHG